jgi:ABC-type branched-subunit amino acid transport system substrate-binding protein
VKQLRWLVGSVCLALLAGACSRSGNAAISQTSTTTAPSATSTTAAGPGPGDFGTLKAVCGQGNATGATDQGVTNTEIDVGTMADPGNQIQPGLDQELFDAATSFTDWCNAAGGILGRKLKLTLHNSAITNVPAVMLAACASDFALVGNGEAFDDAGVAERVKCKLPEIAAYDNSPLAAEAPLSVHAAPMPINQEVAAGLNAMKKLVPNDTKIGFITGNLAGVLVTRDRDKEAAELLGYTSVYNQTYPITGPSNWTPYVEAMKTAGVQILELTGSPQDIIGMEKAMSAFGWYPDAILEQANQYDQRLVSEAGSALKNTYVTTAFIPFEDGSTYPVIKQLVDITHTYDPGGKIAALSANAWTAWLLFAESAKACGSNLTRTCLLQQAASQTAWTAGGLQGPANTSPTGAQSATCLTLVQATPTGFVSASNLLPPTPGDEPFNCDPSNVINLKKNYIPANEPTVPS